MVLTLRMVHPSCRILLPPIIPSPELLASYANIPYSLIFTLFHSHSLSVALNSCLSVYLSRSPPLSLSLPLSMYASLCISLSLSYYLSFSLYLSLSLSLCLSLSLSLTLHWCISTGGCVAVQSATVRPGSRFHLQKWT